MGGVAEGELLDPNLMPFFQFFFNIFFFHVRCFIRQLGTKSTCSTSYGKEKPR